MYNDPAEDKILISTREKAFLKEVIEREANEEVMEQSNKIYKTTNFVLAKFVY